MNITFLSGMWPRPGLPEAGIFVAEQAKALSKVGCSIEVIAPIPWAPRALWFRRKWSLYGEVPLAESFANLSVIRPRYIRPPGRIPARVSARMMLSSIIRNPDSLHSLTRKHVVLHVHRLLPEGWVGVQLKKRFGVPLVLTGHGGDVYALMNRLEGRRLAREVLKIADTSIAVSQYISDIMIKLGAPSVKVIPNGCDLEAFAPSTVIPKFGRRVLYVGRLEEPKGVIDLLRAFASIEPQIPGSVLPYVGDGSARSQLERITSKARVANVRFMGRQPHTNIPAILRENDIFVLPSYAEGLPTALVEAMAVGLAIIATSVGGTPDLISHGTTGLLFPPGDIQKLANSMRLLLTDEWSQLKLRQCARDRVIKSYSWTAVADQLIRLYGNVL